MLTGTVRNVDKYCAMFAQCLAIDGAETTIILCILNCSTDSTNAVRIVSTNIQYNVRCIVARCTLPSMPRIFFNLFMRPHRFQILGKKIITWYSEEL